MKRSAFCTFAILAGLAWLPLEAQGQGPAPAVGSWATYRFTPSLPERQQIIVRETMTDGTTRIRLEEGPPPTRPIFFITYAIVGETTEGKWLQVTTHQTPDGPPLSTTQILISKKDGRALRSQILGSRGVVPTPENELRPLREDRVSGTREEVAVPTGRYQAVRGKVGSTEVWVNDQVPAMGVVKAALSNGILELLKASPSGAKDLLKGRRT